MTAPVSVSQHSFRVATATAAHVVVLLSPALCTGSSPVDIAKNEGLDKGETSYIAPISAEYTASSPAGVVQSEGLDNDRATYIDAIPEEYGDRYDLLQPIPVDFEEVAPDTVIAHFREADLAVTGVDREDAQDSLASWVRDVFDDLSEAEPRVLGATPTMQIRVLRRHLRHR